MTAGDLHDEAGPRLGDNPERPVYGRVFATVHLFTYPVLLVAVPGTLVTDDLAGTFDVPAGLAAGAPFALACSSPPWASSKSSAEY